MNNILRMLKNIFHMFRRIADLHSLITMPHVFSTYETTIAYKNNELDCCVMFIIYFQSNNSIQFNSIHLFRSK